MWQLPSSASCGSLSKTSTVCCKSERFHAARHSNRVPGRCAHLDPGESKCALTLAFYPTDCNGSFSLLGRQRMEAPLVPNFWRQTLHPQLQGTRPEGKGERPWQRG